MLLKFGIEIKFQRNKEATENVHKIQRTNIHVLPVKSPTIAIIYSYINLKTIIKSYIFSNIFIEFIFKILVIEIYTLQMNDHILIVNSNY